MTDIPLICLCFLSVTLIGLASVPPGLETQVLSLLSNSDVYRLICIMIARLMMSSKPSKLSLFRSFTFLYGWFPVMDLLQNNIPGIAPDFSLWYVVIVSFSSH